MALGMRGCSWVLLFSMIALAQEPGVLRIEDGNTSNRERAVHDVRSVELRAKDGDVTVTVDFFRPLQEGVFTCVHLYIDCDDDLKTGLYNSPRDWRQLRLAGAHASDGWDLALRAAVGSRFRRNSAKAAGSGIPAPLSLRRGSHAFAVTRPVAGGGTRRIWRYAEGGATPPKIKGKRLVFAFSLHLLRKYGLRYNKSVRVLFMVESSICESPISLDYTCRDAGIPIRVDGVASDWGNGPRIKDKTGELHPAARCVDMSELRADHDEGHLFARVRFARPGFRQFRPGEDVIETDTLYVGIEPLGARYMRYKEVALSTVSPDPLQPVEGVAVAAGAGVVEVSFTRRPEQTKYRVVAWADAGRWDLVPNSPARFVIPAGAWTEK